MIKYNNNNCYHCGLEIFIDDIYKITVNKEIKFFCCLGCKLIAQTILNNGLFHYYKLRENFSNKIDLKDKKFLNELFSFKKKNISKKYVFDRNKIKYVTLMIDGINCSACVWLIEQSLMRKNGILNVSIDIITGKALIEWSPELIDLVKIMELILYIGYKSYPHKKKNIEIINEEKFELILKQLSLSFLGMMQVMMLSISVYIGEYEGMIFEYYKYIGYISMFITTPVVFYSAKTFFLNSYTSIKNKQIIIDLPISIAIILAYFFSFISLLTNNIIIYFDTICMFIFFLLLGRFFEFRIKRKSFDIINKISFSYPELIKVLNTNGIEEYLSAEDIKIGYKISIDTGEFIPMDCILVSTHCMINESMLTGEEAPKRKVKDDLVYGGTQNVSSKIILKIIKLKKNSKISYIIKLLEKAQKDKPEIIKISNLIASYFIGVVLLISLITSLYWIYNDITKMVSIILSLLVATCPCALSLAVPVAITSSMSTLAKKGFLITKGHVLNDLTKVSYAVFDKTGTLTENKLKLKKTKLLGNKKYKEVLLISYILEKNVSKQFADCFKREIKHLNLSNNEISYIKYIPGNGVEGIINKNYYFIGKKDFLKKLNISNFYLNDFFSKNYNVILSSNNEILALFNLENNIRKEAKITFKELKNMKIKIQIISGDPTNFKEKLYKTLGKNDMFNDMSIKEKFKHIKKLQSRKEFILMIGDGMNDIPALKLSQISISMGSGTDLTKTTSDVVLLNDKLSLIPIAIKHSLKTKRIIKQNFSWAILYNITILPLALNDVILPYFAALGMSISSIIVVLNSLRLMKIKNI